MSLGGERWHSVAFDEAHEMCINKDLKPPVVLLQKLTFRKPPFFSTTASKLQEHNQTIVSRKTHILQQPSFAHAPVRQVKS